MAVELAGRVAEKKGPQAAVLECQRSGITHRSSSAKCGCSAEAQHSGRNYPWPLLGLCSYTRRSVRRSGEIAESSPCAKAISAIRRYFHQGAQQERGGEPNLYAAKRKRRRESIIQPFSGKRGSSLQMSRGCEQTRASPTLAS
jgi:MYXO-CTERM domain-containing protein